MHAIGPFSEMIGMPPVHQALAMQAYSESYHAQNYKRQTLARWDYHREHTRSHCDNDPTGSGNQKQEVQTP